MIAYRQKEIPEVSNRQGKPEESPSDRLEALLSLYSWSLSEHPQALHCQMISMRSQPQILSNSFILDKSQQQWTQGWTDTAFAIQKAQSFVPRESSIVIKLSCKRRIRIQTVRQRTITTTEIIIFHTKRL